MDKGMNPDVMSWHEVRLLHDMAKKGDISKAGLLITYLLSQGADPCKSGASWSTPLAWARKKGHKDIESILLTAGATA